MPDFFLDEFLTQQPAHASSPSATGSAGQVDEVFKSIMALSSDDIVAKTNAVFAFNVTGAEEGKWYLDLKNGSGSVGKGEPPVPADATLIMDTNDFIKMFRGKLFLFPLSFFPF